MKRKSKYYNSTETILKTTLDIRHDWMCSAHLLFTFLEIYIFSFKRLVLSLQLCLSLEAEMGTSWFGIQDAVKKVLYYSDHRCLIIGPLKCFLKLTNNVFIRHRWFLQASKTDQWCPYETWKIYTSKQEETWDGAPCGESNNLTLICLICFWYWGTL